MRYHSRSVPIVHGALASVALLTIAIFLTATVAVELLGDPDQIARVKGSIAWGLLLLVPAMAGTAASGRALAGPSPRGLLRTKYRRMQVAAALGLLVLIPAALVLARWAAAGQFGAAFQAVQTVELIAGATNLGLLGLNFRDGLRLRAARHRTVQRQTTSAAARTVPR